MINCCISKIQSSWQDRNVSIVTLLKIATFLSLAFFFGENKNTKICGAATQTLCLNRTFSLSLSSKNLKNKKSWKHVFGAYWPISGADFSATTSRKGSPPRTRERDTTRTHTATVVLNIVKLWMKNWKKTFQRNGRGPGAETQERWAKVKGESCVSTSESKWYFHERKRDVVEWKC